MPGYGSPPTLQEMIVAVVAFSAATTAILIPIWAVIRHIRRRAYRAGYAVLGILVVSAVVASCDVAMGGKSGIFSIFANLAIPLYMAAIALPTILVAALLR